MEKILKNVLLMVLAFSLVLSFAGCSEEEKAPTPLELATKEVEGFMDALCQYDFKNMASFTDDNAFVDNFGADTLDERFSMNFTEQIAGLESAREVVNQLESQDQKDAASQYIDASIALIDAYNEAFVEAVKEYTSYEITSSKEDENKTEFTISIKTMDLDDMVKKVTAAKDSVDRASVAESIGITEEPAELSANYFALAQAFEAEQIGQAIDALETSEKTTIEIELTLEKQEDKWIIVSDESDYDEFVSYVEKINS